MATDGQHRRDRIAATSNEVLANASDGSGPADRLDEDDLRNLLEASIDWIWETDASLRFSWLSEEFESTSGISSKTILGQLQGDLLKEVPLDDRAVSRHLADLKVRRAFRDVIHRIDAGEGETRWVSLSGFPRYDSKGKFLGYRGTGRDETGFVAAMDHAKAGLSLPGADSRAGQELREARTAEVLERARLVDAVANSVEDPIFVKDAKLEFVFVNRAFASLFHRTPEEMIGRRASDFTAAEEARSYEETERHVLETGEPHEREEDVEASGIGQSRIIRKSRVTTSSGKHYVACFIFDVTELRRREREAEQSHRYLADVLELLPAGVVIYDRHDRFVLANRKMQDSLPGLDAAWRPERTFRDLIELGHSVGQFRYTGDTELDALYDTDPRRWVELYIERHRRPHTITERQNPDGRWFQVIDTRTPDGTFVGVRVEITEIKHREKALQDSMRQTDLYRHVLDELPVSAYVKDEHLAFQFVNKVWSDFCGIPQEAAIGRTDRDFFGGEGEGFASRDLEVIRTGITNEVEECLTHRDGTVRQLIARKSRLVSSDGSIYLIGSSTDITEIKDRERQLQEAERRAVLADRAKSEFLANMSHEIRTPMNGVLGMAELLAKSSLDSKQKTFVDIIVKSGNALLTIINDILDFSKIDSGQLVLDPAPFNLAEAIEDVATLVSTRAKEKDLELIVRVAPGLSELFVGDVGRIRQIITNLLGNAVKFTDAGYVLVDVSGNDLGTETRLEVRITDTGIGIPQDKLQLIFEKFSQVDGSSTRRHEGTGLGLAITSRLVEMMGGEIGVESTEGKGSTFRFTLVLPNAGPPERKKITPVDVTGARILIVDDNPVNRSILSEQMMSWGFDSCAACHAQEGLAVLLAAAACGVPVDCVVLDYQMPGMTGADLARIVRSTPVLADLPIVMLTSVDQSLSNAAYRDLEINAHLIKPARSSALLETLVATIQKHRAAKEGSPPFAPGNTGEAAPVPQIAASQTQQARPKPVAKDDHCVDILVAEDNEVNQLVFTQILGETSFTFEIVGNGRRAFEAFRERRPRMILMDVSMPEMNGLEATAAIRKLEAELGSHVPIIGVTAHALKGDRERCLDAGMDDYLSKPISPKALLQKVERWAWPEEANKRSAG